MLLLSVEIINILWQIQCSNKKEDYMRPEKALMFHFI